MCIDNMKKIYPRKFMIDNVTTEYIKVDEAYNYVLDNYADELKEHFNEQYSQEQIMKDDLD